MSSKTRFNTASASNEAPASIRSSRHCGRLASSALSVVFLAGSVVGSATAQSTTATTDLLTVYQQAQQYDADFRTAQLELDAARKNIPLARSAFLPQLSLIAEGGIGGADDDGQGSFEKTLLSLSLTQSLFNRSNGKSLDQARIGVTQAEAQYAAIDQELILRVAESYFAVLRAQATVEFSQSELQAISRQRDQAERRFDVGLVPITDVRSAQAQYDLAVAQEIDASNQLSAAQEALLRISGINPDLLTPLAEDLPLTPPEPADISAWVEVALEQNLDLVIAELSNQNSATQVAIERASRYPTLDLLGTAAKSTTEELGRADGEGAEIKLQLRVPIVTGGRINAQVAQAKLQARASEQTLLSQQRTTTQQTRDAYRGVQASISRVRALRQALVSTQQSAEATEAGFRAGTRTSVEVLQALRDTFRAQSDYSGARYDYIINSLQLKAAAGTLSEDDLFAINRFLAVPEE